jgi:hypothetical protein
MGASASHDPLVDSFRDSYLAWRDASDAVRAAYKRWSCSHGQDRNSAFATYSAALDREERAARIHWNYAERLVERARTR